MTSGEAEVPGPRQDPLTTGDPLDEVLESLEERLREALLGFRNAFDRDVSAPIREAGAEVSGAHGRAMVEAELHPGPGGEENPAEPNGEGVLPAWLSLSVYRNAVLTEVLEPLKDALLTRNTGQDLEEVWASLRADLVRSVAALPAQISRPEPPDLYLSRAGDSFPLRAGKGLVRGRRWISSLRWKAGNGIRRIVGRKPVPPPSKIQVVPIRSLAEGRFLGSFASHLEGLKTRLHSHCALPLAALESTVTRWTREWPLLETRLEKGGGYLHQELRVSIQNALERINQGSSGTNVLGQGPLQEMAEGDADGTHAGATGPVALSLAEGLAQGLAEGETFDAPGNLFHDIDTLFDRSWEAFSESIRVAGSFMGSSSVAPTGWRTERIAPQQDKAFEAWVRWHRTLPNRLLLSIHLLRLREEIAQARLELVEGVARAALVPLADLKDSTCSAFLDMAERANRAFSGEEDSLDPAVLSEDVRSFLEEGCSLLERSWIPALAPEGIERTVHRLADEISTGLAGHLPGLPDALSVQAPQPDDGSVSPARELRQADVRQSARQVLDVLRLEGIRNAPEPLLEIVAGTRQEAAELLEALRFNLEAAREELTGLDSGSTEGSLEEAASLTKEGLARVHEGAARMLRELPEGWTAFLDASEGLLGSAYAEIHARLTTESGVQEQLMGVREGVRHWIRTRHRRVRLATEGAARRAQRGMRKWTVRTFRAIRFGRRVVGGEPVVAGEGDRALSVIRQAPEVLAGLPLIYRRLFSFEPVTDGVLLKGRAKEVTWVRDRFQSWERGLGTPALLTGPMGAGHTSFFNILSSSVFSGARLVRIDLEERIREEHRLVALLSQAFGFTEDPLAGLADLGFMIRSSASEDRPWVVLIERLEHLFLRTLGGTGLFEDFLSLQAQTSDHVFWLSSMSGAAWKLVAKTEPRAVSLVQTHPLTPPSREELEALILARHGRSGLPLEFRAPSDLNPLIRRRLRLSRGEKAHQKILQTEYFDRLHRMSQDSIPLAILHWLRSTDFQSGEGTLFLTPPAEIRYAFLEDLDLELDFALKAFLEHGSLTLEEYREVFSASEDESIQTFEALRSRLLLEPTGGGEGLLQSFDRSVGEGIGYRIPALLSQVVARRLKSRNILH